MANEIRVRPNFVAGGLSADMASGATSMSSAGLADLPAITTVDHAALTLWRTDLAGRVTQKEIVWVTAHTGGASTATVVRAREGTTAQNWVTGDRWSCSQISSDVPVICTSSTRPSNPYTGELIFETDTKLTYWYDGAAWQKIIPGDSGWQTPTLLNGWVAFDTNIYGPPQYRKLHGVVYLRGLMKSGTTTPGTNLFILPGGYRPTEWLVMASSSNNAYSTLEVTTAGEVKAGTPTVSATWLGINNVSFPADG